MTKLLISVRSAAEAEAALVGGADLIDVKEPHHGALGRASADVLREVASAVAERAPLSAALGELGEPVDASIRDALNGYTFAKVGLAGAAGNPDWREHWAELVQRLPSHVAPVGVSYADAAHCDAPPAEAVMAQAAELGCRALLLDTFHKTGCNLFEHWAPALVKEFVVSARELGMTSVLAGSLDSRAIRTAAAIQPDFVAVRSAGCEGGRTGSVSASLVAEIARGIRAVAPEVSTPH